jgi:hypothetical protein
MAVGVLTNITYDPSDSTFSATYTADAAPTASAIRCGFIPRYVVLQQTVGAPAAINRAEWHDGMPAGTAASWNATSVPAIIAASNGIVILTGGESAPAAIATNGAATGAGFTLGTGVQTASIVYSIKAFK